MVIRADSSHVRLSPKVNAHGEDHRRDASGRGRSIIDLHGGIWECDMSGQVLVCCRSCQQHRCLLTCDSVRNGTTIIDYPR